MSTLRKTTLPLLVALLAPVSAFAQTGCNCLLSPLNPQFSSISSFIAGTLKVMVEVALPIIAVFIVIAGFQFVAARGNSEKLSRARMNFFYVILGALLILGAWVLATLIGATVTQVLGG